VDVNEQEVKALSEAADLPLGEERLEVIAPQLTAWLEAANDLNRALAAPEHQTVMPITVFRHPPQEGREE
jgi:hypothetical protein